MINVSQNYKESHESVRSVLKVSWLHQIQSQIKHTGMLLMAFLLALNFPFVDLPLGRFYKYYHQIIRRESVNLRLPRCPQFFLLPVPFITAIEWKHSHSTVHSWLFCKLLKLIFHKTGLARRHSVIAEYLLLFTTCHHPSLYYIIVRSILF